MKRNLLTRLIAALLVPCLIGDPCLALTMPQSTSPGRALSKPVVERFAAEALTGRVVVSPRSVVPEAVPIKSANIQILEETESLRYRKHDRFSMGEIDESVRSRSLIAS